MNVVTPIKPLASSTTISMTSYSMIYFFADVNIKQKCSKMAELSKLLRFSCIIEFYNYKPFDKIIRKTTGRGSFTIAIKKVDTYKGRCQ